MSLLDTASLIVTPNGYKEGKLYSVIPSDGSGDLSVTRATTATRVNSQGLVELVPYNLVQYSEDFANGYWINYQSSETSNNTTAPNGTLTADKLTQTGVGGGSIYTTGLSLTGIMTLSCYFKAGSIDEVIMDSAGTSAYWGVRFNLTTQAITYFGVGANATIASVGNGWFRCSVSADVTGTNYVAFGLVGAVNDYVYLWGAQLNEGTLKDYQKTETRLNIPRLDYSNGTCPSILVEPQRTNYITYSSSFNNAAWISGEVTLTSGQSSPQGINNAFKITGTSATNAFLLQVGIPVISGNTYTASVYLKGSTSGSVSLRVDSGSTSPNNPVSYTTEWQRFTYTFTAGSTTATAILGGYNTWTGSEEIFVYGFQLEAGSYASSYIPTIGASVTRNADVISKTGISSLIGQTEGTLFWDTQKQLGENDVRLNISDGTTNNWLFVGVEFNNQPRIYCNVGGANQFSVYGAQVSNDFHKIAFAYKANDFVLYIDGVEVISHTSGSVPTCSRLDLGVPFPTAGAAATSQNKAVSLWKTRLTNTQLAQLTTI